MEKVKDEKKNGKKVMGQVLKIQDVIALNRELHQMTTEPEISFVTKYDLVKMLEKTKIIVRQFGTQRDDLFKKYGEKVKDEDGNETDQYTLVGTKDREKAEDELEALIDVEEEFKFSFDLKDFKDIKSSTSYIQIMKFIK